MAKPKLRHPPCYALELRRRRAKNRLDREVPDKKFPKRPKRTVSIEGKRKVITEPWPSTAAYVEAFCKLNGLKL